MRWAAGTGILLLVLLGGFVALPTAPLDSKVFWAECRYGPSEANVRYKKATKSELRQAVEGRLRWLGFDGEIELFDSRIC